MNLKRFLLLVSVVIPITISSNAYSQLSNNSILESPSEKPLDATSLKNIDKLKEYIKALPSNQKDALSEKYLYGQNELTNNWHFIYGPLGNKNKVKTLKFFATTGNGAAEFTCKNNGSVLLRYSLIQIKKPAENSIVDVDLTINSVKHTLPSLVSVSNDKNYFVAYEASGLNVLGALSAINKLIYNEYGEKTIKFETGGRNVSFPTPNNNNNTKAAMILCSQWYNASLDKISNNSTKDIKTEQNNANSIEKKIDNSKPNPLIEVQKNLLENQKP